MIIMKTISVTTNNVKVCLTFDLFSSSVDLLTSACNSSLSLASLSSISVRKLDKDSYSTTVNTLCIATVPAIVNHVTQAQKVISHAQLGFYSHWSTVTTFWPPLGYFGHHSLCLAIVTLGLVLIIQTP